MNNHYLFCMFACIKEKAFSPYPDELINYTSSPSDFQPVQLYDSMQLSSMIDNDRSHGNSVDSDQLASEEAS